MTHPMSKQAQVVRVVILGAGSSSSTPRLGCLASATCKVCLEAYQNPASKNHRLNPSLLIQVIPAATDSDSDNANEEAVVPSEPKTTNTSLHSTTVSPHANSTEYLNILIDCGKTFRETAMKLFPSLGVQKLHAVLLTHDHADACFGIDDLREFTGTLVRVPMPVYLDPRTDGAMRRTFGYLYPKKEKPTDNRWVAALDWITFEQGATIPVRVCAPAMPERRKRKKKFINHSETPVGAHNATAITDLTVPITSVPIEHGPGYMSNGFVFDLTPDSVCVYFSDISRFDASDEARLKAVIGAKTIAVLVLDMLSVAQYFSHFCVDQALQAACRIRAKCTYFVGMTHVIDYAETDRMVADHLGAEGLIGHLAHDGCVIFDSLSSSTPK